MIEQQSFYSQKNKKTMGRQHMQQKINSHYIKQQLMTHINKQRIASNNYIKVLTSIQEFSPIFYQKSQQRSTLLINQPASNTNVKIKSTLEREQKNSLQETIFQYGSQLYLKTKRTNKGWLNAVENQFDYGIKGVQILKTGNLGKKGKGNEEDVGLFFQVLIRGQYLTIITDGKGQGQQVKLSLSSSNNTIWAFQYVEQNLYQIFNISKGCYLSVTNNLQSPKAKQYFLNSSQKQNKNQITFALTIHKSQNTLFIINCQSQQKSQYLLAPYSSFAKGNKRSYTQQSSYSLLQNPPKFGQSNNTASEFLSIRLLPVQPKITNLLYELKFAHIMMMNNPSFTLISEIVQQLIYYNIPQFSDNENLLSSPIQKLTSQKNGISASICSYLIKKSQQGFTAQLSQILQKDIRLLCLGCQQNCQIFSKLINNILASFEYFYFLESLCVLIRGNEYFIEKFQSENWCEKIFNKLEITYEMRDFYNFKRLLGLVSEFCVGPKSIPNKYLVFHTLQRFYQQVSTNKNSRNSEQEQRNTNFWIKLFQEGQFIFVQVEDGKKYNQIELENYLSESQSNRLSYCGEIKLIGSLCQGFNINIINKFYNILKVISSYCYNITHFPQFKNPKCKEYTMQALVKCFDWKSRIKGVQNKYNIGIIFNWSQIQSGRGGTSKNNGKRDRANTVYKLESLKLEKVRSYESQNFTDILRHFLMSFQDHMLNLYQSSKQVKNITIIDLILSQDHTRNILGGNLVHWIKIISIILDTRLISVCKKKIGPYTEYFKRILESNKRENSKQKGTMSPKKKIRGRNYSQSDLPFTLDKDYENEINLIFDLVTRVISYNPVYKEYLEEIKQYTKSLNQSNINTVEKLIENIRKSNTKFVMKRNFQKEYEKDNGYNKVMDIEEVILEPERKQIQYVDQVKLSCYRTLTLLYQNILEQQLQQQLKNLSYYVEGTIKFSNKVDLIQKYKKLPFVDDNFKISLFVNWYLMSKPEVLNEYTTVLRYIYQQMQIWVRGINTIIILFTKQSFQFYQAIQPWVFQVHKLATSIHTWYIPQILHSCSQYYENYTLFHNSLQNINTQLRNPNLKIALVLNDYQQILENLGIIQIFVWVIGWINKMEGRNIKSGKKVKKGNNREESKSVEKESFVILNQLAKIMQFFTFMNEKNKKKLIICLSETLTNSLKSFQILFLPLYQNQRDPQSLMHLLTTSSLTDLVNLLPQSKQFFQLLLSVPQFDFIILVQKLSYIILEISENIKNVVKISKQNQQGVVMKRTQSIERKIMENNACFLLFCKIVYRVLKIGGWGTDFLRWFIDDLLGSKIEMEIEGVNFKTKNISEITEQIIQSKSSIAYLLYNLYNTTTLKSLQRRLSKHQKLSQSQNVSSKSLKIRSAQGNRSIMNYIILQALANLILENNTVNVKKQYCQYYIFDVLPLLTVSGAAQMLENTQLREGILQFFQKYWTAYKSLGGNPATNLEIVRKLSRQQSMEQNINTPQYHEKRKKQLQNFIINSIQPQYFIPREKYLQTTMNNTNLINEKLAQPSSSPSSQKVTEFEKQSKKAMKTWYKARLALNQQKQNYMSRDKFLIDIQKLDKESRTGTEQEIQKIINSNDIISKMISVLSNAQFIHMDSQNQIFIVKNVLLWVDKLIEAKKKSQKHSKNKQKPITNPNIIKNITAPILAINILLQLQHKLDKKNTRDNILSICYHLKLVHQLFVYTPASAIQQNYLSKILQKLVTILYKIVECFYVHLEIVEQFEEYKVIDCWEGIQSWIPIVIVGQIVGKIVSSGVEQVGEMEQIQEIVGLLCQARIMFGKVNNQKLRGGFDDMFKVLKQFIPQVVKFEQENLINSNYLYATISKLG